MRKLLTLILLAALPALAADFGGAWKGTMKLKAPVGSVLREGAVSLQLKQTGDAVTGQAATDDDNSQEVQDGKAEGNTLTFHVTPDDGPPIQVKLTLAGGELAGEARGEVEGQKVVAELKFQRQ